MSSNAENLGRHVLARRKELDLIQVEVWQAGGPSNTTLTTIEKGELPSLGRATARKLDIGLQWEAGSARAVWNGGEPTPILRPGVATKNSAWIRERLAEANLDDDLRRELLDILDERESS